MPETQLIRRVVGVDSDDDGIVCDVRQPTFPTLVDQRPFSIAPLNVDHPRSNQHETEKK